MAGRIPVFDANYGTEMARLRTQRSEGAADRAATASENQKAFWRNFGANLLGKAIDIGGEIGVSKFKDGLVEDREAIDRGAYAPAESDWIPNESAKQIREMAQAKAAEETRSMTRYQDAEETPRRRVSIDPVAAAVSTVDPVPKPLSPKVAERINTLGILPAGPPVEAMSVAAPAMALKPRPSYEPEAPASTWDTSMGGQPLATPQERNRFIKQVGMDVEKSARHLDPKTQAKLDASQAKLDNLKADTDWRKAQANPDKLKAELDKLGAEQEASLKLAAVRQQKLDEANRVAMAKLKVGTPENEAARQKSVETAVRIAQSTEVRESGSGSSSFGYSGGGKIRTSKGGSSGQNLPRVGAIAVADDMGWGHAIIPDGQRRYVLRGEDGLVTVYVPEYDADTNAYWGKEIGRSTDGGKTWLKATTGAEPDEGGPSARARARATKGGGGGGGGGNPRPATRTEPTSLGDVLAAPFTAVADAVSGGKVQPTTSAKPSIADMTNEQLAKYQQDLLAKGQEFAISQTPAQYRQVVRDGATAESVAAEIKRREDEGKKKTQEGEKADRKVTTYKEKLLAVQNSLRVNPSDVSSAALAGYSSLGDVIEVPVNGDDVQIDKATAKAILEGANPELPTDDPDKAKALQSLVVRRNETAQRLLRSPDRLQRLRDSLPLLKQIHKGNPEDLLKDVKKIHPDVTIDDIKSALLEQDQRAPNAVEQLFAEINALPWSRERKMRVFKAEAQKRGYDRA